MSVESTAKAISKIQVCEDSINGAVEAATQTKTEGRIIDVDAIKLFVGQIPRTMNKEELLPMFREFGEVYNLSIIKHRVTNEHAGCAFLTFFTRAAAERAITALHDKRVLPGMKNAMQVKPAHGEFQCKLFVGMIPHTCTASEIESIFIRFGEIVELNLLKRRSKVLNKGCAFIQYKYKHQALKAIEELHGKHVIEGSTTALVVKFADNRKAKKAAKAVGRGRWRGGQMQRHGGFQHGRGNVRPYPSHYFSNPMLTYQSHQSGGNRWYGGGYGHGWAPVYLDSPSYYGGPNPSEIFYSPQMHYPPMPHFGNAAGMHHVPILNETAGVMSPSATAFSPTVNASTYTSTTVSTAAAARGSTDNKSINTLTENS